jgi:hypothetical protein
MAEVGIALWLVLLGAFGALEFLAYADGDNELPTASQLVKRWRRSMGWAGRWVLAGLLTLLFVVLLLHWVWEVF